MSPDLQPPAVPDADGVACFSRRSGKTPETSTAFAGGRSPLESSLLLGPGVWNDLNSLAAMPDEMKTGRHRRADGGTDDGSRQRARTGMRPPRNFPGVDRNRRDAAICRAEPRRGAKP